MSPGVLLHVSWFVHFSESLPTLAVPQSITSQLSCSSASPLNEHVGRLALKEGRLCTRAITLSHLASYLRAVTGHICPASLALDQRLSLAQDPHTNCLSSIF